MKHPHAVIRKSNTLIEASYKLSTNEQRLILVLVSSVRSDDKEFCPYRISIKEFAKLLDIKNKNIYKDVEDLVLRLREKTISIFTENSILHTGWLSSIEYFKGEGIIELCFDPKLKPFLLELRNRFTSYKLKMIIQLRSSFSIRIYELLKQYEKIGFRIFELADLRNILGIKEEEYPFYGNFKARIIIPAQKELAERTDIAFDFEEIKVGRGVGKIKFIIRSQTSSEVKTLNFSFSENVVKPDICEGIKDLLEVIPVEYRERESIRKMILLYAQKDGKDYVMRNIIYTNENSNALKAGFELDEKSNYRMYLSKTLQNDYGLAYQEEKIIKEEREIKRKITENNRKQKQQEERTKFEIERDNNERAKVYLSTLTKNEVESLRLEAIKSLNEPNKTLVAQKNIAAELIIKIAMNKIAIERMNNKVT